MPVQKRTPSEADIDGTEQASKRTKEDTQRYHPNANRTEEFGIINREFYPPEMSNARCQQYNTGTLVRPIETLQRAYEDTADARQAVKPNAAVVHWFKSDLRLYDNRALQIAYQTAKEYNIPLLTFYIVSPQDFAAHIRSPPRVDLILRTLALLKRDLGELDIPLYMETQEKRGDIPGRILDLCLRWGANHVFTNLEYEVDELRREAKLVRLCADSGVKFEGVHDTCVVTPGQLFTQQGKQYAVFSPWYRSWLAFVKQNPEYLEIVEGPSSNPGDARKYFGELFEAEVPEAPANKRLSAEEKKHFEQLYPAGEHEAIRRLEAFLEEKGKQYNDQRNMLFGSHTSVLSPYFASGALSARTAIIKARQANRGSLDRGDPGYASWISEVAWRDFYKHVLAHWPFIW